MYTEKTVPTEGEARKTLKWHDQIDPCGDYHCQVLHSYWAGCALSSHYDGEREIAGEIPLIMREFHAAGWPLDDLLTIQSKRVVSLVSSLVKGNVHEDYHNPHDAVREIHGHFEVLQKLAGKDGADRR